MFITDDIRYVGVNDHDIDLFEGQYVVKNGMAYNSYVIMDEKIAVMDSVDAEFRDQWMANIREVLGDRKPDYIVVHHMEPDHSANVDTFMAAYPEAKIVASARAFAMMKLFFGTEYADRRVVVREKDTLELGKHTLSFIEAPMVHWPEVVMSYDACDRVLFSADAFGKFGSLDVEDDWVDEARRYYIGIVGKFGVQTQKLLKKAAGLDIQMICSLHGPVLKENLGYYLGLYNTWSSYKPETEGILVAYTSVYGNTKKAVEFLVQRLRDKGAAEVKVMDLARCDLYEAIAQAFRYSKLVVATTSCHGDLFPFMTDFLTHLTEHNYQKRTVALVESGAWAPIAARLMKQKFEKSKGITFTDTTVHLNATLSDSSRAEIEAMTDELCR